MERGVWIYRLKEGTEQDYEDAHRTVWDELIRAARDAGFRNHTVFRSGRNVIAYLEADNMEEASARLGGKDVKQRWNRYMSRFMESTGVLPAKEVFHFD